MYVYAHFAAVLQSKMCMGLGMRLENDMSIFHYKLSFRISSYLL